MCFMCNSCVYLLSCTQPRNPALSSQSFYGRARIGPLNTKGDHDTRYENLRSDATKGAYYVVYSCSYLSPERLPFPFLLPFYSLDILGRHLLNQHYYIIVYFCSPSARVFPVFHIVSTILLRFLALLHPSSALPDPVPRLSSLGVGPPHDTTVSLGRRVLQL